MMADFKKTAAAKAASQYSPVETTGQSLGALMRAVKSAQEAKHQGGKAGKKAMKAKAMALKAQIRAQAAAQETAVAEIAAIEKETQQIQEQQQADARELEKTNRRLARKAAVDEGRRRQLAQVQKVKQIQNTIESELRFIWAGNLDKKRVSQLKYLQASLRAAWGALPPKLQYEQDRKRFELTDSSIAELETAIAEDARIQAEPQAAKTAQAVPKAPPGYGLGYAVGNKLGNLRSKVSGLGSGLGNSKLGLAASMVGRSVTGMTAAAASSVSSMGTRTWSMAGNIGGMAMVQARRIASASERIASGVKTVADKGGIVVDFMKSMLGRLWRVIRKPIDMVRSGGGLFSKVLGWGALLTSVVAPLVAGLYRELKKNFSVDSIVGYYNEAKTWLYDKITSWFESFFAWGKEKMNDAADAVTPALQKMGGLQPPSVDASGKSTTPKMDRIEGEQKSKDLRQLYEKYKDASNSVTRKYYEFGIKSYLRSMRPEDVPTDLAPKLQAAGFTVPKVTTRTPVATIVAPAGGGATTAGGGAVPTPDRPVVATPKASMPSGSSGDGGSSSSSSGGLPVSQIPRSLVGDSTLGFNTGTIAGY